MNTGGPLILMKDVCFHYTEDKLVLHDVSFTIESGDFVAFVGQNGAGKTTCAKLLNGVLHPSSGEVVVGGMPTRTTPTSELSRLVGYCYQNPDHQIWALKVGDELAFGPRNLGMSEDEVQESVEEALELAELQGKAEEYTFSLGWGERQKLAVASILAMRPQVIIVDEPTTGLDWSGSVKIMDLLSDLNARGLTVVIISHDMSIVAAYARRALVFAEGAVVTDGPIGEVMRDTAALAEADLHPPQWVRVDLALRDVGLSAAPRTPGELTEVIRERLRGMADGV